MTTNISNLIFEKEMANVSDELKMYFQNKFSSKDTKGQSSFMDEPYIEAWERYYEESIDDNAFEVLKKCYPQLRFPIEEEINKTQNYIDAVLKGKEDFGNLKNVLELNHPEGIEISIYKSIVGKVPVIKVTDNQDFTSIIQSLLHKNNPVPVPQSMGAILVNGINNWDRLHTLKQNWLPNNPLGNWNEEFSKNVLPNPTLFKDKIIILSTKPYSNVAANILGISESAWKIYSYLIRLEHECTHLYTLKKYGYASNNLHDELIADYIGMTKTIGYYDKYWMLAFMGLEEYPTYRKGARLENYLGNTDLSFDSFEQLIMIIKKAIDNIALFDSKLGTIVSTQDQMSRIDALCETDVFIMASSNGTDYLLHKYKELAHLNS
jgi:hypothetical protein